MVSIFPYLFLTILDRLFFIFDCENQKEQILPTLNFIEEEKRGF